MNGHGAALPEPSAYRRLLRNRALRLLWTGEAVSVFGDAFFNLTVVWVIYAQSRSALQTAIVQVVWQLADFLFGPVAGVLADRWDRKRIMVVTNLLAAAVVGAVAIGVATRGYLPPVHAYAAIFALNGLTAFLKPARAALMPAVVGRELLATATGLFSTIRQAVTLLGDALAGAIVAVAGAVWAVAIDALSFVFVALCIAAARLPGHARRAAPVEREPAKGRAALLPAFRDELRGGWRIMMERPVVRAMVRLGALVNVASFLGPLYPALVGERLHAGAAAYGALGAASVGGAMVGGALAGPLERRWGAGRVLAAGWGVAGACVIGMAASPWLALTLVLAATNACALTAGGVAMGAAMTALVPDEYRGRVAGLTTAVAVVAIPVSALLGGWLADMIGVAPLFSFGGLWILGVAGLAWSDPHVRAARL